MNEQKKRSALRGRVSWVKRLLGVALGLSLGVHTAYAQDNRAPKSFLNKGIVHLPIQIDDNARPRLQEVQLFVKEGPQAPWQMKEKVPPTQTFFTYRAAQDGEYWFNVVTVDRNGVRVPADVNQEAPGLIVIIDSTPPQAEVQFLGSAPEGQQVHCEIRDANPDPAKTRFFFQTRDQVWRPLEAVAGQADTFCIPGQAAITGMIRVTGCDLAGNTSTREFNLGALPVGAPPVANQNQNHINQVAYNSGANPGAVNKMPAKNDIIIIDNPNDRGFVSPTPPDFIGQASKVPSQPTIIHERIISEKPLPLNERVEIVANKTNPAPVVEQRPMVEPAKSPFAMPSGPDLRVVDKMPVPPHNPSVQPTVPEIPLKRHLVNNGHVFLDYQIEKEGASGVGKVELWYTTNMGQSWQKFGEDPDRKSPAEIDLPGEGIYGVTIVVANGRGFGANPPQTGDTPDWWIEVDTTKPKADLVSVRTNPNGEDGSLYISWSAKDKNLHSEPIDLYYALQRQGPWLPIAKNLKNDGTFRWTPSPETGSHALNRLTVRDQAGNSSSSETIQPVALDDLSRPRGRVVGVNTAPRTTPLPPSVPPSVPPSLPLPPQGN